MVALIIMVGLFVLWLGGAIIYDLIYDLPGNDIPVFWFIECFFLCKKMLFPIRKKAATVLITRAGDFDNILAVSRKDNPDDFGLIGGKANDGETFKEAAI